jgi:DNA modification methylase
MTPRWRSGLTGSEVYEGDARIVAQTLPAGSVTCSILDGPYNLGKAEWDRVPRGGTLGDLYTGHLDDVGRLSAPSASLYVWNNAPGWAQLHPLILARGWVFEVAIVWDKQRSIAQVNPGVCFADVAEICGYYWRGAHQFAKVEGASTNVWRTNPDQVAAEKLRGEVKVRSTTISTSTLHPCQKPLLFAERMIRASTRPGDAVWVPFGGTLREMVAAERMARGKPGEARRVISCELNADGKDYIGPAVAQAQGLEINPKMAGQEVLFR